MGQQDLTLRQLQEVAMDIGNRMDAYVQGLIDKEGVYPHDAANWASEVPHPCRRFLVYCRTHWQERKSKSIELRFRLDEGRFQEDVVEELLRKCGYKIVLQQMSTSWSKYQLRGRIDGFIEADTLRWPMEITSVQPWYWASTATVEAINKHSKPWIRKKTRQLNLYLLLESHAGGFLIIKTFGKRPRLLPMLLDYGLAELDIQTCVAVNEHVAAGTLPERVAYSSDLCGLCDFEHVCMPLQHVTNLVEVDPKDYATMLRYVELQEAVDEASDIERLLIGNKKKPGRYYGMNAVYQDVRVVTKSWETKVLKLPAKLREELNKKYMKAATASRTIIELVGGDNG